MTGKAEYDVIVVGGGNAALCAALAARQTANRVLILERSTQEMRGGNTRHTRNIRCAHSAADKYFSGPYSEEEFWEDLVSVTGGPENPDLARLVIRESKKLPQRISSYGVHWQQPLAGTLHLGRTNRWFLGGGKTFLNSYYRAAASLGIEVRYNSEVEDLLIEDDRFDQLAVLNGDSREFISARAVVIASGGYESNINWLKKHWGDAADNFVVRGTPNNDGGMLANLFEKGAKSIGDPKGFHAIAVDARAPKYDGGIVTRLDSIPFGIVVNRHGYRFYDEGQDFWPKRYAIWGGLIAGQPDQIAFSILDSKTIDRFLPPVFPPFSADSIAGLALTLKLNPETLKETVSEYNSATMQNADVNMEKLDGNSAVGLKIPKSNWALPIDKPPYFALPLRPGITFTYMGVAIDDCARVLTTSGEPMKNVFAAGEIVSGNVLTRGYLGGFGLTLGSVFGELAGRMAGRYAQ